MMRPGRLRVAQPANNCLGQEERPAQIDGHHLVVFGLGGVPEIGSVLHAGVVDQNVGGAEFVPGRLDQFAHVFASGYVGLHNL